jgi:hypothetical protein
MVMYGMIMEYFALKSRAMAGVIVVLIGCLCVILMPAAAGADVDIEGIMGDTITFHGFSYIGDSVYLFLTGPGLPVNGVTLTDISQRADQGHFTVVNLDDNQEWTYIWKTSRIASEIDPGTYIVYVTNKPADLSHLGGESSYKTFSVFLKDSGVSKVSISAQHAYTRNPLEEVSTPLPLPSINITTPPSPSTTVPPTPEQTTVLATRAGTGPLAVLSALLCCGYLVSRIRMRP